MAFLHSGIELTFVVARPIEFRFEDINILIDRFLPCETVVTRDSFTLFRGSIAWRTTDPTAKLELIVLDWKERER